MIASLRALLSLAMLTGFYLVALMQLAGIVALTWWLATFLPGQLPIAITFPMLVAAGGSVAAAMWSALRSRHEPVPGVVVSHEQAGPLWTMVRELASAAKTTMPDEIRIVAQANASVSEAARWLGLRSGKRYLYLGLPLLQSLTTPQIRAIVAHELGHYSHARTRLGSIAYRGRAAVTGTISRIHSHDPVGWIFRAYLRLYLLVDRSASRVQELQADTHAVKAAGKAAAASALIEVHVLAIAFEHFLGTQVNPRADYGFMPDDLYAGFATFLSERQEDLAALRQQVLESQGSLWDTHPPVRERIAEIEKRDDPSEMETAVDEELVGRLSEIAGLLTPRADHEVLPWPEFVAAAASAQLQAAADVSLRAIRQRTGKDALPDILSLIEQGEHDLATDIPTLVGLAALRSGTAHWQASWAGPTVLVGTDGEPLPLNELARLARKPGGTSLLTSRLQKLGIETTAATIVDQSATARGAQLLGGLGNIGTSTRRFGGSQADLLIVTTGLILVKIIGDPDTDEGKKRLEAALAREPLHEIGARHRFIAFEEIHHVDISRQIPLRAKVTLHSGEVFGLREPWTGDKLTKDSPKVLLNMLSQYQEKRS